MSLFAFILVFLSAITHAGWNLLSKSEKPSPGFYLKANLAGSFCLLPFLLLFHPLLFIFPVEVWSLLGISGLFQGIYFLSLERGYRQEEMTLLYPLVRAIPVLIIAILSLSLGQSSLTIMFFAGALLIIAGSILLPLENRISLSDNKSLRPLILSVSGAVLGSSGYTLSDSHALNLLTNISLQSLSGELGITLLYWFFECVFTCMWLALALFFEVKNGQGLSVTRIRLSTPDILVGLQIVFTYFLVLLAMNHASNVSYIAALRQVSIPLGVVLGVVCLKEKLPLPRLLGCIMIFGGVLLISLYG